MAKTKKGAGFYFDAVALILAVVGIVAMVISSTISAGYEFSSRPLYLVATIVAVVLVIVAMRSDLSRGDKGPGLLSLFALGVAIFLLTYSGVQVVASRALTISGLFSWNSMDTAGWNMFYVAVVSAVCLVVSSIILTVGGFLPVAKLKKTK